MPSTHEPFRDICHIQTIKICTRCEKSEILAFFPNVEEIFSNIYHFQMLTRLNSTDSQDCPVSLWNWNHTSDAWFQGLVASIERHGSAAVSSRQRSGEIQNYSVRFVIKNNGLLAKILGNGEISLSRALWKEWRKVSTSYTGKKCILGLEICSTHEDHIPEKGSLALTSCTLLQ
jgi:hypothetical protein